jgi:streptogramin lyase
MLLFFLFPLHSSADGGAPNLAYVAGTSRGVSVIDIGQQNVNTPFSIDGDPHTIYLSLDGRFLYITQPSLSRVTMISARTGQTVCTANVPGQPSLLAFDPGANVLYTAGNGANSVTALDPANCNVERTLSMNSPVYGLAVAVVGSGVSGGNGNQLWVADSTSLTIFDSTGKQLDSIPVPGGPQYVTIPAGEMVYVTTRQGTVDAIDLNTHKLIPSLLSGGTYGPMDYDAITGEVYVPDLKSNAVDVLTPLSSGSLPLPHEPSHVISLGVSPQSIAITSDGQLGFVALQGGNVAMLDIPGKAVVNTFHVGGNPRFIITGLYPPLIGTTPQQASIWGTVINILAYVAVIALFSVPLLLFIRYSKAGERNKGKKKEI